PSACHGPPAGRRTCSSRSRTTASSDRPRPTSVQRRDRALEPAAPATSHRMLREKDSFSACELGTTGVTTIGTAGRRRIPPARGAPVAARWVRGGSTAPRGGGAGDLAGPRQTEHALGKDVALDPRRPREDRRGAVVEPRPREPSTADRVTPRHPAEPARPEKAHRRLVHAVAHLAPEELDEARLRPERLAALDARQPAPVVEPADLDVDEVPGDSLP